jgi:hypothetical protein
MHIAIDPGKRAGWAVCSGDYIARSCVVDGDDPEVAAGVLEAAQAFGVETVVIEDQFIGTFVKAGGRRRPRNPKGIKTLLKRRHLWEIPAEQAGLEVVVVNPSTWQAHFHIKRGDKAAIVKLAGFYVQHRGVEQDEADAILMAMWWEAQMHKIAAMSGGGK